MNYLYIGEVNGLYNEMYMPDIDSLLEPRVEIKENILDANNHFWSEILDLNRIEKILGFINKSEQLNPQYISIVTHKKHFLKNVREAKNKICDGENSPQQFFSYLETLNLVCQLYTDYVYFPFILSLQEGFLINNFNAKKIWDECLNPTRNPYINYINENIIPLILKHKPQMLFLKGKPSFYNMCIARIVKEKIPHIVCCFTRHSSEYYSLNKIDYLLTNNNYFFKDIDVVILEGFIESETNLLQGKDFEEIPNIIYKNKEGNIIQNKYDTHSFSTEILYTTRPSSCKVQYLKSPSALANVQLEPYTKCFWNKCAFCGINKKYHFENDNKNTLLIEERLHELKKLINQGISYVWFIDEAISTKKLLIIAKYIIAHHISIRWQVRSRICQELLDENLVLFLAKSGLKEIRLGLESASLTVLKKMNKFDQTFSLELVEDICELFYKYHISVHFPIIIGFPGETSYDRKKTYDFLRAIHNKYPNVTFNINLFGLDICSPMFANWTNYEITDIHFPCLPSYFLGNIVDWSDADNFSSNMLADERDKFMRDVLYPWMPHNATLPPYIFYRLSETIRNTLYWKEKETPDIPQIKEQSYLVVNSNITISYQDTRSIYIIYNWNTHHYMIGNNNTLKVFEIFSTACELKDGLLQLYNLNPKLYPIDDLKMLIKKLYSLGYLDMIMNKKGGEYNV